MVKGQLAEIGDQALPSGCMGHVEAVEGACVAGFGASLSGSRCVDTLAWGKTCRGSCSTPVANSVVALDAAVGGYSDGPHVGHQVLAVGF